MEKNKIKIYKGNTVYKFTNSDANNPEAIKYRLGLKHNPEYVLKLKRHGPCQKVMIGHLVEGCSYKIEPEEEEVIIIIKKGEERKFSLSEANDARKVKQKFGLHFEPEYVLNIASGRKVEIRKLVDGCD